MTLAERRLVPTPDPPVVRRKAGRSAYAIRALYHALRGHLVLAGDVRQHRPQRREQDQRYQADAGHVPRAPRKASIGASASAGE